MGPGPLASQIWRELQCCNDVCTARYQILLASAILVTSPKKKNNAYHKKINKINRMYTGQCTFEMQKAVFN